MILTSWQEVWRNWRTPDKDQWNCVQDVIAYVKLRTRQMCNYWTNFAKTGNPNGFDADGSKMPEWTPHTAESRHFMLFGDKAGMDESNKSELAKFVLEFGDDIIETLKFKR